MSRDVEGHESSRPYFQDDKHLNDPKADGDGDEEITGQQGLGLVADLGPPALGWSRSPSAALRILQQVFRDGSR